jgi:hypothetical protein
MRRWLRGLAVSLALTAAGCGDAAFIISVNSGFIVGDPLCHGPDQFQLRDQGGLVLLVVITSSTHIILAGGGSGTCSDLSADTAVQVSGRRSGDHITATVITVE